MPITTMDEAEAEASRRFQEKADEVRDNFQDQFDEALPGNHSVADAVLLAHLLTGHDGYNDFVWVGEWDQRRKGGFQTSLSYLADPFPQMIMSFALEARCGPQARQLAIFIDDHLPGQRTPDKIARENALSAKGWRIFVVSEAEVLADPAGCLSRIESVAFRIAEEAINADFDRRQALNPTE